MTSGSFFARFRLFCRRAERADKSRFRRCFEYLSFLLLIAIGPALHAETIRAGDALSVRVVQWNATSGEMRAWDGWKIDYRVNSEGRILLPFAGSFDVAGEAPGDLADQITQALINTLFPSALLGVTVDIMERQPVYIHGVVRSAGEVPYREGMTVREAIAIAGGLLRTDQANGTDLLRSGITTAAQITQLRLREDELMARAAHLTAQTRSEAQIESPTFNDPRRGAELLGREELVFELNEEKRARTLDLIDSRVLLPQAEIEALNQRSEALAQQQEFAAKQLDAVMKLSSQGLSANARVLEAQRTYSAIESQLLDVSSALLAAKQDIARAEADRLEVVQGQATTALNQLQSVLADLDEARSRRVTQERLLGLTGAFDQPAETLRVTLFRADDTDDAPDEPVEATMATVLEPGDIVEVILPLSGITGPETGIFGTEQAGASDP